MHRLLTLTLFHVIFSEFSDVFHREDDISFSESMNSFFSCIFLELNKIKTYA